MPRILKKRETLLAIIIVAMIAGFAMRAAGFAEPANLANIFNDTSILIILALAQMTVILTKSIDLSVAANLALALSLSGSRDQLRAFLDTIADPARRQEIAAFSTNWAPAWTGDTGTKTGTP